MVERFGLGATSFLVSENKKVAAALAGYYPGTAFTTADLYPELMDGEVRPDFIWNVCLSPPSGLAARRFGSVICHSLLEHVIDPTAAYANMLSLLEPAGHLYFCTHTPSMHYHPFPRDYVRFHHDYFEDLPRYLNEKHGLVSKLVALHSTEGLVSGAYQKAA